MRLKLTFKERKNGFRQFRFFECSYNFVTGFKLAKARLRDISAARHLATVSRRETTADGGPSWT